MTSINGATVLVTGANGGIGTALVNAALERGAARVYAAARTPKEWSDERVVPLRLDLTDPASIEQAANTAGDTTILVNNAAIFARSDLLTGPIEDITATIETNLVGPLRLTRALAPSLRSGKGALVNINSVLSWFAVGKAHSVSKAGMWMATNALRLELAPEGVGVLGVYPGPTDTPMQPGEDRAGMNAPADVAGAVYDALEAGEHELLVDDMTKKVHSALSAPVTALYPALASD
ncbi:SDR family oxidoreductase [Streptomyces sp. NPDC026672]|uniref:SDR family oxidoreductase n=1 Tax=unclassified Streptomyces TaxID=2593676 RepID=UPI0033F235CB